MKQHWRRVMSGLAFAGCLAMLAPGCMVRAQGKVRTRAVIVVDDTNPPPKPKHVTVQPRSGYVWVRGHWEYTGARWVWMDGRWEREQPGKRWEPGHWEKRGNKYHWVAGYWVSASGGAVVRDHRNTPPQPSAGPTQAPPPPRAHNAGVRAGYVWISGRWDWKGGEWAWTDGHWERARTGHTWTPGRWELRGGVYVWVDGQWTTVAVNGGGGGNVRDHRAPKVLPYPTQAPPPPQAEKQAARAGYVWITGRWDWKGGKWAWTAGHWERAKANHNWVHGRWEHKGDRYVWVEGRWEAAPAGNVRDHRKKEAAPTPPPVKNEKVKAKRP